jgi:hypothetical protein
MTFHQIDGNEPNWKHDLMIALFAAIVILVLWVVCT